MGACIGSENNLRVIRLKQEKQPDPRKLDEIRYQINKAKALNAPLLNLELNKLYMKRMQWIPTRASIDVEDGQNCEAVTVEY
ncbi:unnamed protein product [Blepharisma stoltei]|uniref:Uncharacterized protein n=1 Tax=Blepharisma stoltei TaxID=1481888 RepID=A0AAU9IPF5_9CILI|nr:unnamed protein product [Blepharisma stoltei]